MGVDRIRAWLSRAPKDVLQIDLRIEQIGISQTVSSWPRDELIAQGDGAQLICDAAQAHCDALEAAARYTVHFVSSSGAVIGTAPLKCRPEGGETKFGNDGVEDASIAGVLGQILRHQEVMTRMYVGAQSGVLGNMQQLLTLQSDSIKSLNDQLKTAHARVRATERAAGDDATEGAEALARAEAISKVGEAVAAHLVPVLAARMNGHVS